MSTPVRSIAIAVLLSLTVSASEQDPDPTADTLLAELRDVAAADDAADAERTADDSRADSAANALQLLAPADVVPVLGELIALLPRLGPVARSSALHAIGNGLLAVEDPRTLDEHVRALGTQAAAGVFFSPAADRPALHWCEYVRAVRRAKIRRAGTDRADLERSLGAIHHERLAIRGFFADSEPPRDTFDLTSFGQHGTRHELEAIAELAAAGGCTPAILDHLNGYLRFETPARVTFRTEPQSGIGEPFPAGPTTAGMYSALWRDDYRFALARTILDADADESRRQVAAWHLIYSPRSNDRRTAVEWLSRSGANDETTVGHLIAALDDPEPMSVREAIVALGRIGPAAASAIPALEALVARRDGAQRAMAQAALRQIRD